MKLRITIIVLLLIFYFPQIFAGNPVKVVKYRRSSLAMVLIESESFPNKDIVMDSWNKHPFPDKYNNHSVGINTMNPQNFVVTSKDLKNVVTKQPKLSLKKLKIGTAEDNGIKQMPIKIEKFIKKTDLAKKLVSKWFDRSPDGKFDMQLIEKRGFYNASEMDAAVAKGQIRGLASLGDAGEQLINNTFVTFSKVVFVPNEVIARGIRDAAILMINRQVSNPIKKQVAILAAKLAYKKAKEGYSVWTHTWLYKLKWNDSIASVFYTKLWNDKEAYDSSNLFSLKYVGMESSRNLVTFSVKRGQAKRSKEQVIDLATGRNIDKVFAKLQKTYDVFKPKVPVLSTDPITAQIGLKEGIKPGDKFEVLEMEMDTVTGKTNYVKVGRVKVSKRHPIWDDRYNAGQKPQSSYGKKGKNKKPVKATTFDGSSKIQPGMLLVQIK